MESLKARNGAELKNGCFHYPKNLDHSKVKQYSSKEVGEFITAFNLEAEPLINDKLEKDTKSSEVYCPTCIANGYRYEWSRYLGRGDKWIPEQQPPKQALVHAESFDKGVSYAGKDPARETIEYGKRSFHHYSPNLDAYPPPTGTFQRGIEVNKDSIGEVFHLAVAKVLLPSLVKVITPEDSGFNKTVGSITDTTLGAMDFLKFYRFHVAPDIFDNVPILKSAANKSTEMISAVFAAHSTEQDDLFKKIRSALDRSPTHDRTEGKLNLSWQPRTRISALCRCYLERFLEHSKQKPLPAPKADESVLLLYYRCVEKDTSGRNMFLKDKKGKQFQNFQACLDAVEEANHIKGVKKTRTFKHVIIFGDFSVSTDLKEQLKGKSSDISYYYIPQPWKVTKDERPAPTEERYFWSHFRREKESPAFEIEDGVPLQVKNLGLFMALQDLYQDKVCCVGYRSGFLDGAAFIGMPVFYFDETVSETKATPRLWSDLLWNSGESQGLAAGRMVAASDKLNTLIRIDLLSKSGWVLDGSVAIRLAVALNTYMLENRNDKPIWRNRVVFLGNVELQRLVEAAILSLDTKNTFGLGK
ncbi:hypothetical protein EJ08DRAFT_738176 [Tothia fuscella]|uniref:Uncharacterized protein n=1 Tax=Tothia fuscella TaxID=1048955 RepID=A0A9P4NH35_9PEZI|nr:hypothetical protein EJ08DRAFT_738176 [Tothia fuscella]